MTLAIGTQKDGAAVIGAASQIWRHRRSWTLRAWHLSVGQVAGFKEREGGVKRAAGDQVARAASVEL
jgi:hypothetical protein